jgi:hypothetical protein
MADKEERAIKLGAARESLESRLREVFQSYGSGTFQFELNVDERRSRMLEGDDSLDETLRNQIMSQIESFEQNPDVSESGMRVYKVTAIDSDGDGQVAMKVQYEYGVKPGMGTR